MRFFKLATLCLDDSFAHSWHSLNQLHEVVTWNAFQLTDVPCLKLICVVSFLLNVFQPISCIVTRSGWNTPYLVKDQVHIMARTAQISKEKRQSIITLKHEDQQMQNNSSKFLQVQSQNSSSAMMKLALMRTATEKEDPELLLLQRISLLV